MNINNKYLFNKKKHILFNNCKCVNIFCNNKHDKLTK